MGDKDFEHRTLKKCGATRSACACSARATSLFDPPEADKCLLAFGEFSVGRSMFDVQSFKRLGVLGRHLGNRISIRVLDLAGFHVLQNNSLVVNLPKCRHNIRVELGTDTFIYNFQNDLFVHAFAVSAV